MKRPMYAMVASALQAYQNCLKSDTANTEWESIWEDRLGRQLAEMLPSGNGFDAGCSLNIYACQPDRLVFNTSFHHTSEIGYYNGWTNHQVIVTPSLTHGFNLRITGKDKNDIKCYIAETFHQILSESYDWEQE